LDLVMDVSREYYLSVYSVLWVQSNVYTSVQYDPWTDIQIVFDTLHCVI